MKRGIPAAARRRGGHPARRTFQAIRMEVNRELPNLAGGLDESVHLLTPEGRMLVLAYHSLEDRMVKERFADWSRTEEPGYVPHGPARARTRNPIARLAHPPRRCGRRRPRSRRTRAPRAPASARSSASRRDHEWRRPSGGARRLARRSAHAAPLARRDVRARPRRVARRARSHVGRVACASLALVTVFALVSAVVFHVILAQNQLAARPPQRADRHGAAHLRAAPARPRRCWRRPQRIIQEAERLGLVRAARPAARTSTCRARRCPRADRRLVHHPRRLVEGEAAPWRPQP